MKSTSSVRERTERLSPYVLTLMRKSDSYTDSGIWLRKTAGFMAWRQEETRSQVFVLRTFFISHPFDVCTRREKSTEDQLQKMFHPQTHTHTSTAESVYSLVLTFKYSFFLIYLCRDTNKTWNRLWGPLHNWTINAFWHLNHGGGGWGGGIKERAHALWAQTTHIDR